MGVEGADGYGDAGIGGRWPLVARIVDGPWSWRLGEGEDLVGLLATAEERGGLGGSTSTTL